MPRMIDANCTRCDFVVRDIFEPTAPERVFHVGSDGEIHEMEIVILPRARSAQLSDRDAVVVYRDSEGKIRYPARNDLPTPNGCERVVLRSLREVERFERSHNVRHEATHFDRGSGRSFDEGDGSRPPRERIYNPASYNNL